MNRITKWILTTACLATTLGSACGAAESGASASLKKLFGDPVIARGKGVEVKRSDLEDAFIAYKANLAAKGDIIPESERTFREAQLLDRIIVTQLLVNRTTDADRVQARELARKYMTEAREAAGSEEKFERQLKAVGLTPEKWDIRVMEQSLAEAVVDRELKSKLSITDAQVKEFYETGTDVLIKAAEAEMERADRDPDIRPEDIQRARERAELLKESNLSRLEDPPKVRVRQLLLGTRDPKTGEPLPPDAIKAKKEKIEQLLARVRAGEDFAKLVEEFSEDRAVHETHGIYTLSKDDSFVPEFKAAAFSLAEGQVSDVVRSAFGYHLIKLEERVPAKKLSLDKATLEIRQFLMQQEIQKEMPGYFDRLKKAAGVEILDEKYKRILERNPAPLAPGS